MKRLGFALCSFYVIIILITYYVDIQGILQILKYY